MTEQKQHLLQRIDQLEKENASLKQDAARYRWLRDDSNCCQDGIGEIYVTQHRLPFDDDSMDIDLFMEALDEAIDTAMRKD